MYFCKLIKQSGLEQISAFVVTITKHLNMNKQDLYLSAVGAVTPSVFYTFLIKASRWLSFALLCFLSILELYEDTGLGNNVGFNC